MPDLILRNVDESMVAALRTLAGQHGRSAEAEHREILAAGLLRARKKNIAEVLATMPDVGERSGLPRIGEDTR